MKRKESLRWKLGWDQICWSLSKIFTSMRLFIIISPCTEMWRMIDGWHTTILTLHFWHTYDIQYVLHSGNGFSYFNLCHTQILSGYLTVTISLCNRNDLLDYARSSGIPVFKLAMSVKRVNEKLTSRIRYCVWGVRRSALKNVLNLSNTTVKICFVFANIVLICVC